MTSNIGAIYLLADPDTNEVRYVGQAINPRKRISAHIARAKTGIRYPVYDWIRSLLEKNKTQKLSVEVVLPRNKLDMFEKSYIKVLRESGYRLLNVTDGGSVPMLGRKFTIEHRQKISNALTGKKKSDEACKNMSEARIGRKLSKEHIEKLRQRSLGHTLSVESRSKISNSRKGMTFTEKHRENLRNSHLGQVAWNKGTKGIPHPHVGHHVPRKRKATE